MPLSAVLAAARRLEKAHAELHRARVALAAVTVPGASSVIRTGTVAAPSAALRRHRSRLLQYAGVVGVGLGPRTRRGYEHADERCVVVYVRRKRSKLELRRRGERALPHYIATAAKKRIGVDVIEFGRLIRHAQGGDDLGPGTISERGTLGVVAIDLATNHPVALTAMHVVGGPSITSPDQSRVVDSPSDAYEDHRRLGTVLRGSTDGIDAAVVTIEPPNAATRSIRGLGAVAGWRPVVDPADTGIAVAMTGAVTGHPVFGRIVRPHLALPELGLDDAMLVDIDTANGDSGSALIDHDHLVLGLLVGYSSSLGHRVFTSIGAVLAQLRCNILPSP